jgi:hypothetical protein
VDLVVIEIDPLFADFERVYKAHSPVHRALELHPVKQANSLRLPLGRSVAPSQSEDKSNVPV